MLRFELAGDEFQRFIARFRSTRDSSVVSKLDALMDIERLNDPAGENLVWIGRSREEAIYDRTSGPPR